MSLTLTTAAALWLLAAVPLVWLARRFARTNFNVRQQWLQAGVRSLALALVAFALARPVISLGSSRLSVAYVVDVSHSISSRAIGDAAKKIDDLNAAVRPAHFRIVAFGADVTVLDSTAALKQLADADLTSSQASLVRRDRTDLEQALREARAEIPPGHVARIVLFSDGRATAGDVGEAVVHLAAEGVPVFVEPLAARDLGDAWVERVQFPARVEAGALVTASIDLGSQRPVTGVVELREGGKILASRDVSLTPGTSTVAIDIAFDQPGAHLVDATLATANDPLVVNNSLAREVVVGRRAQVLYVEGAPASARYLQTALERSGFDVAVRTPAALPRAPEGLEPWDVVILSDVGRSSIPDAAMTALGGWVEQGGGGLLIAGGDSVFGEGTGEGGYRHTELERLSPVTFERKDEPEVAMIIVLDRSWSMAGQVMELCKSAAQAAIQVMTDEQSVGVLTFNDAWEWNITLRNVGRNRAAIQKAIAAIEPAGHTLIYPAVEQAYLALQQAHARAKHVVLLSDGRSYPDDYEGLVQRMVAAKMTVSSIAVGPAADVELLTNIARWGKGRGYVVEDAKEVPQIFVKEAKNASTPAFDEKAIAPVLKTRGFLEGIDFSRVPALRGRTATVIKDSALKLLETKDGDPLLAFWPIGAGRAAVFASDVKDRWASDWLQWRGYAPFFAALVRALERQRQPGLALSITPGAVRGDVQPLTLVVEARGALGQYDNLQSPSLTVTAANGRSTNISAVQTAPGRYEANLVANATERLAVAVNGADSAVTSRLVVPDPHAEYRFRQPDEVLLKSIADATGGTLRPTAEAIRTATSAHQTARRALWPVLMIAAMLMWLGDVLLRRVRLFEAVS